MDTPRKPDELLIPSVNVADLSTPDYVTPMKITESETKEVPEHIVTGGLAKNYDVTPDDVAQAVTKAVDQ